MTRVFWDKECLARGVDWERDFRRGLRRSCFYLPLISDAGLERVRCTPDGVHFLNGLMVPTCRAADIPVYLSAPFLPLPNYFTLFNLQVEQVSCLLFGLMRRFAPSPQMAAWTTSFWRSSWRCGMLRAGT